MQTYAINAGDADIQVDSKFDFVDLRCNHRYCIRCGFSGEENGISVIACKDSCKMVTCASLATHGWGIPIKCPTHKISDMVFCCFVRCEIVSCLNTPSHGRSDKQPVRCVLHKKPGDIKPKGILCVTPGCNNVAAVDSSRCGMHGIKINGIGGLKNSVDSAMCCMFPNCTIAASLGFYDSEASVCLYHSAHNRNIYAKIQYMIYCKTPNCQSRATQYSNFEALGKNPYLQPDICIDCARGAGIEVKRYGECDHCGCYTILGSMTYNKHTLMHLQGSTCASCIAAMRSTITLSDQLLQPIHKRFNVARARTGEFICSVKQKHCKSGRHIFRLKSGAKTAYNKFILSLDVNTPMLNRIIRAKKLKSNDTHAAIFAFREDADANDSVEDMVDKFVKKIVVGEFVYEYIDE
ncbi:Hypothetical protein FSTVST1_16 [Faustovirus ST1]|nr:Hypothetical protein FSTVST1_16 [Faustovirus ST1]